jgi:hypothetical protein
MGRRAATLERMGRQPKRQKKPNRSGVPLHVYLPPEVRAAMDALADDNRRSLTTEVLIALENHLKATGRWPLSSSPPPTPKEE